MPLYELIGYRYICIIKLIGMSLYIHGFFFVEIIVLLKEGCHKLDCRAVVLDAQCHLIQCSVKH